MGREIVDEVRIQGLFKGIERDWASFDNKSGDDANATRVAMMRKVEEFLQIDYDQIMVNRIVQKLIDESKEKLVELVRDEQEFSADQNNVFDALQKLRTSVELFRENKLNFNHFNIQENVHNPAMIIAHAVRKEIDVNRAIERVAERIKQIMNAIERDV